MTGDIMTNATYNIFPRKILKNSHDSFSRGKKEGRHSGSSRFFCLSFEPVFRQPFLIFQVVDIISGSAS